MNAASSAVGPGLGVPDPMLGWSPQPGTYSQLNYLKELKQITVLDDRSRSTGIDVPHQLPAALFFGCSFTAGSRFLNDADTYPALVQRDLPQVRVKNYGVDAYGTYQSLLWLETVLAREPHPWAIVYGFVDFHRLRNVSYWRWQRMLVQANGRKIVLPFVRLEGQDGLRRFPPERYPDFYLSRWTALGAAVEDISAFVGRFPRMVEAEEITLRALEEMQRIAAAHGAHFFTAFLFSASDEREKWLRLFQQRRLTYVDCVPPKQNDRTLVLAEDGHPNAAMNAAWAKCVTDEMATNAIPSP